jgi:hypothetical protein
VIIEFHIWLRESNKNKIFDELSFEQVNCYLRIKSNWIVISYNLLIIDGIRSLQLPSSETIDTIWPYKVVNNSWGPL